MTNQKRQWIAYQLAYTDATQKSDLLNPAQTTDDLLNFLWDLLHVRAGVWQRKALLITAVRADHPTQDGPDGHAGGNAVDFADNNGAPGHLLADVQACSSAKGIGVGGEYRSYADALCGYSASSRLFEDNATDHIHVQVVGY